MLSSSQKYDDPKKYVEAYQKVLKYPTIESAQIITHLPDMVEVRSVWSQRCLQMGEITKFRKHHLLQSTQTGTNILLESLPIDVTAQDLWSTSPSGKYHCVVRKMKDEDKEKQYLEVWNNIGMYKVFDIAAFDIHGEIYCDSEFATLEWSPNEDKILYVAERKIKKSEPFYKQDPDEDMENSNEPKIRAGQEYLYKGDWGEQLQDRFQPVACICDLKTNTLRTLEGIAPHFSPSHLSWAPDETAVFGVVIQNEPRRSGLVYCLNRRSYVFVMPFDGAFKILSDPDKSVRSVRVSPDGKNLYWLQRVVDGPHNGCHKLMRFNFDTDKQDTKLAIVLYPGQNFSGLFTQGLPQRCFSQDGTKLFFTSVFKYKTIAYYLDLVTNVVHALPHGEEGSATVLDVYKDLIVISTGSLKAVPRLKICNHNRLDWVPLGRLEFINEKNVVTEFDFDSKDEDDAFKHFSGLYYGPPNPPPRAKVPLIVYPHGGPHSASVNDFTFEPNFFVALGYGVLMVNYRGSVGEGENSILFLLGKISDTDVRDNQEALTAVMKAMPYLDERNIFLYGRSHGGFIALHMAAQHPTFFKAMAVSNAVTDVAGMYNTSDIADWAVTECEFAYDEAKPLNMDQWRKLISCSPLFVADKIKTPTVFFVGRKDLRVPFYQGIKMYNTLKGRSIKTKCYLYDDNHTLGSVPHHIDSLINAALWFYEHKEFREQKEKRERSESLERPEKEKREPKDKKEAKERRDSGDGTEKKNIREGKERRESREIIEYRI